MNINEELDRIQKKGVSVTLRWNRSVRFIGDHGIVEKNGFKVWKARINFSRLMKKDDKDFNTTIYQAILDFDDKYPELVLV